MDYAAATPVDPRVVEAMIPFLGGEYGNPSALHNEGVRARDAVVRARKDIADLLQVHLDEIIFTGSATESLNLALCGIVRGWQMTHPGEIPHVITSAIEHDAVLEPLAFLEKEGVRITRIPVDEEGIINREALKTALTHDTVLVSIMYANNEIGTIQPIKEIGKIIRKWKKEHRGTVRTEKEVGDARYPLLHTDACQAVNYAPISVPSLGVDLMTLNAAKIYGPKGIGLLYCARGVPLEPLIRGGGHERGLRAGTENVSGIVGFAAALAITLSLRESESARLIMLRDRLIERLEKEIPEIIINGSKILRLPNNIHFSLPGVDHEYLALLCDARGFAVATKSACNEFDAETSHVLHALRAHCEPGAPISGLRISLGRFTALTDIELFMETLKKILPLARYSTSDFHSQGAML